jgi:hypothetical protein
MTAFLGEIGGREIDGDALGRHGKARRIQRGADSFARFSDRLVAETDHREDHVAMAICTCTSTGRASMPSNATVATLTTMARPAFHSRGELNEETVPWQEQ